MNHRIDASGYRVVSGKLPSGCTGGLRVARLVAMAFVPNDDPEHKTEVHHIDYNRQHDCADNLLWVSHADNVRLSLCNRSDVRGVNNPNYANHKLTMFYAEHPDVALVKQSRPGGRNGRARPVRLYKNDEWVGDYDCIMNACHYMQEVEGLDLIRTDSIFNTVRTRVGTTQSYRGYTLEYIQ